MTEFTGRWGKSEEQTILKFPSRAGRVYDSLVA